MLLILLTLFIPNSNFKLVFGKDYNLFGQILTIDLYCMVSNFGPNLKSLCHKIFFINYFFISRSIPVKLSIVGGAIFCLFIYFNEDLFLFTRYFYSTGIIFLFNKVKYALLTFVLFLRVILTKMILDHLVHPHRDFH